MKRDRVKGDFLFTNRRITKQGMNDSDDDSQPISESYAYQLPETTQDKSMYRDHYLRPENFDCFARINLEVDGSEDDEDTQVGEAMYDTGGKPGYNGKPGFYGQRSPQSFFSNRESEGVWTEGGSWNQEDARNHHRLITGSILATSSAVPQHATALYSSLADSNKENEQPAYMFNSAPPPPRNVVSRTFAKPSVTTPQEPTFQTTVAMPLADATARYNLPEPTKPDIKNDDSFAMNEGLTLGQDHVPADTITPPNQQSPPEPPATAVSVDLRHEIARFHEEYGKIVQKLAETEQRCLIVEEENERLKAQAQGGDSVPKPSTTSSTLHEAQSMYFELRNLNLTNGRPHLIQIPPMRALGQPAQPQHARGASALPRLFASDEDSPENQPQEQDEDILEEEEGVRELDDEPDHSALSLLTESSPEPLTVISLQNPIRWSISKPQTTQAVSTATQTPAKHVARASVSTQTASPLTPPLRRVASVSVACQLPPVRRSQSTQTVATPVKVHSGVMAQTPKPPAPEPERADPNISPSSTNESMSSPVASPSSSECQTVPSSPETLSPAKPSPPESELERLRQEVGDKTRALDMFSFPPCLHYEYASRHLACVDNMSKVTLANYVKVAMLEFLNCHHPSEFPVAARATANIYQQLYLFCEQLYSEYLPGKTECLITHLTTNDAQGVQRILDKLRAKFDVPHRKRRAAHWLGHLA